jgi:hypothetical protein
MIISKHFVFIRFPRTGGRFVRKMFKLFAPHKWEPELLGEHMHVSDIPASHQHLPRFGFVRNPYDWYVSWYSFHMNMWRNEIFNEISDNGKKDFKSTLITGFEMDYSKLFKDAYDTEKYGSVGGYTAFMLAMFGSDIENVRLGRFENLRHEFLSIISDITELPLMLKYGVNWYPKVNKSPHKHYSEYYDDELRETIAEKDKMMIHRFGYQFEDKSNS